MKAPSFSVSAVLVLSIAVGLTTPAQEKKKPTADKPAAGATEKIQAWCAGYYKLPKSDQAKLKSRYEKECRSEAALLGRAGQGGGT